MIKLQPANQLQPKEVMGKELAVFLKERNKTNSKG